jgi:hypothetical protein
VPKSSLMNAFYFNSSEFASSFWRILLSKRRIFALSALGKPRLAVLTTEDLPQGFGGFRRLRELPGSPDRHRSLHFLPVSAFRSLYRCSILLRVAGFAIARVA